MRVGVGLFTIDEKDYIRYGHCVRVLEYSVVHDDVKDLNGNASKYIGEAASAISGCVCGIMPSTFVCLGRVRVY